MFSYIAMKQFTIDLDVKCFNQICCCFEKQHVRFEMR